MKGRNLVKFWENYLVAMVIVFEAEFCYSFLVSLLVRFDLPQHLHFPKSQHLRWSRRAQRQTWPTSV